MVIIPPSDAATKSLTGRPVRSRIRRHWRGYAPVSSHCVPQGVVDQVLWPEFQELNTAPVQYLEEVTLRVIAKRSLAKRPKRPRFARSCGGGLSGRFPGFLGEPDFTEKSGEIEFDWENLPDLRHTDPLGKLDRGQALFVIGPVQS
jgi:hypothetical protein